MFNARLDCLHATRADQIGSAQVPIMAFLGSFVGRKGADLQRLGRQWVGVGGETDANLGLSLWLQIELRMPVVVISWQVTGAT